MSNWFASFRSQGLIALLAIAALVGVSAETLNLTPAAKEHGRPLSAMELAQTEDVRLDSVKAIRKRAAHYKKIRGKVPGWLEAYQYWYEQRAFPNDRIDWSKYRAAVVQREKLPAAKRLGRSGRKAGVEAYPTQNWEFMGPTKLDVPYQIYYGQGDLSGRTSGLAFAPTAGTYYLAAAGGGVWKTTNSGSSWNPQGDEWSQIRTSSVAVHPTNSNIVYVGTGDYDQGASPYGIGVMKSTNGGSTWTVVGAPGMKEYSIRSIVIDPEDPNIIHASAGRNPTTFGRVYRSTDGGNTWDWAFDADAWWSDLAYGAKNGNSRYLYAVGEREGGAMWRSADRGVTWEQLATPMTGGWQQTPDIACSPTQPNTVYLLSGTDKAIFKSTNAGNTWTNITAGFPADIDPGDNYNWSQIGYDQHISCSTRTDTNQDVVYVGLIDIVASPNGGQTWVSVGEAYQNSSRIHNDQHSFAVNPANPNECLVGCDGGTYKIVFNPANTTWSVSNLNSTIGIAQFYRSAHHPTDANRGLGGTQDNATPVLLGDLSDWVNRGGGDGGFSAINPVNPNVQYCTVQFLVVNQTTNQWGNQFNITPNYGTDRKPFIGAIAINPSSPRYLYAGTNFLWRFDDDTDSWSPRLGATELATVANSVISYIGVSPTDANRIYVGSNGGDLWTSGNGGTSWTRINTGSPSLPTRSITSICVNPANPLDIIVSLSGTGSGHVWRLSNTTAGTRVWVDKSGAGATGLPDLPANTVAIDPDDPANLLYVGTDIGCFATDDGGATWQNATVPLGLPNVQVSDLHVTPGTGYLTAATYGRGMWRVDLKGGGNPTYNIGGTVTLNGAGLQGVSLAAKQGGATVKTGTTVANGTYSILDLTPGTYTVVPTKANTTFAPASTNVTITDHHMGNVNFTASTTATTYTIAGRVTDNGAGIEDVAVQAVQGGTLHHTFTLADGTYTIRNVAPGTYTVTPSMQGRTFQPASRSVPVTNQNVTGINFTSNTTTPTAKINGRVTRNGAAFAGVTVSAAGVDDTTDANGNYSLVGLTAGTYTVTPSKTGVLFNPASRQVNLGTTDANNINFATDVPIAPETLTGTALSETQVRLNWTNVSQDETGYKVDRSANGGGFTEITGLNLGANANTVTLNNLTPGTDYTFRVRSYNQAGDCDNPPTVQVTTPAPQLAAPTNLVAKAKKKKKVLLNWTDNSKGETGFGVEIRLFGTKEFTDIGSVTPDSTGAVISRLQAKKTYDFRVYAFDKNGKSPYSNIATAKAKK